MNYILKNAFVYTDDRFLKCDVEINNGIIVGIGNSLSNNGSIVFDFSNKYIFPGFTDVHVHLREPGFLYKETIKTGSLAAAHSGYTTIFSMPNLKPAPDCMENLIIQLDIIKKDAVINVIPYGTITVGEEGEKLSKMDEMKDFVAGFSDDGKGVQSDDIMMSAMKKAKELEKIIVSHCEDNSLLNGGYIHDGEYAKLHNHKGISSESEWRAIERDIKLLSKIGCKYHVCHVSCKESVELIRKAKRAGLDITCETAPHYLLLNDMMIEDDGRFKMNPPIRGEKDREALIEGILDGTVDMIATDHAPHSKDEKNKGLRGSLMGVSGLDAAFPILYTNLVKKGVITLEKLICLMSINPSKRFGINKEIKVSFNADLTVFDLNKEYTIDENKMISMGKSSPFTGENVFGECEMTMLKGDIVWMNQ